MVYTGANSKYRLQVIQGDSLNITLYLDNDAINALEKIKYMHFTCAKLELDELMTYDENNKCFSLLIPAEFTAQCESCVVDYDITAEFQNGEVVTMVYRGTLSIYPKTNA